MLCYRLNIQNPAALEQELQRLACDPGGIVIMREKLSAITLKITDILGYCAIALKEAALSAGAECALPKNTIRKPDVPADIILLGTPSQIKIIAAKCTQQAFKQLRELGETIPRIIAEVPCSQQLMGILNVTPDSFSDGGKFTDTPKALAHAQLMITQGATIIDIGGESTRPGAVEITEAEELARVIPVITELHKHHPTMCISIDTTKSSVARAAVNAGATMINDISGLTRDPEIARVAAETGAKLVIMHRLGTSSTMQQNPEYTDLLKEILLSLQASIALAREYGVSDTQIIVDPGIGFGKTTQHNLYILQQLGAFHSLGYPVMLGVSRKSVIGNILNKDPQERILGTAVLSALTFATVDYLRVHDLSENKDALLIGKALSCGMSYGL